MEILKPDNNGLPKLWRVMGTLDAGQEPNKMHFTRLYFFVLAGNLFGISSVRLTGNAQTSFRSEKDSSTAFEIKDYCQ